MQRFSHAQRLTVARLVLIAVAALVTVFATAIPATPAQAHKPVFPDRDISSPARAWPISNPQVSWAIYASLQKPGEAQYYTFTAPAHFSLYAQIVIPAIDHEQNFAPHLALLGPGLGTPTGATAQETAGLSIPEGLGVQVFNAPHAGATDPFNEPFTQTTYWQRQDFTQTLPQAGRYYLAVFTLPSDKPATGKYTLAVGTKEEFGPGDLLTFPFIYFRVRAFADAGVPAWVWVALVALIALGVAIVARRRARRQAALAAPASQSEEQGNQRQASRREPSPPR